MKDFTHRMGPLGRVFAHEGYIRGHKGPCVVMHIAGVGFLFHTPSVAASISRA
jgi:hypothetical protein